MRRGFKTMVKQIALDVREELELTPTMPFDPKRWADLWGIPLLSSADIGCSQDSIERFHGAASGRWSAALIPKGNGHLIVYNASHAPVRFMSDVSHEAGHVILEHPRLASLTDGKQCGNSKEIEDEANELAGELLLPASAALQLARRGYHDQAIAEQYEISIEMARWRMKSTGARLIAQRQRAAYDRARGTSSL